MNIKLKQIESDINKEIQSGELKPLGAIFIFTAISMIEKVGGVYIVCENQEDARKKLNDLGTTFLKATVENESFKNGSLDGEIEMDIDDDILDKDGQILIDSIDEKEKKGSQR